jgi:hypothetical protein
MPIRRASTRVRAVNSGSLPTDLLESTLFGHVKGRFHQRHSQQEGRIRSRQQGHDFFDEVGTIGPETQAKLLRVIQEKEFTPLGVERSREGRCADSCRHQCGPAQDGGGEKNSAKIFTTGSTSSTSICRRCATGAKIFRC